MYFRFTGENPALQPRELSGQELNLRYENTSAAAAQHSSSAKAFNASSRANTEIQSCGKRCFKQLYRKYPDEVLLL